jgi:hypothetical protein
VIFTPDAFVRREVSEDVLGTSVFMLLPSCFTDCALTSAGSAGNQWCVAAEGAAGLHAAESTEDDYGFAIVALPRSVANL